MSNIVLKDQLHEDARNLLSSYGDVEAHLLFHRGITTNELADSFLNPKYDLHSYSPSLFVGIQKGVSRVLEAMEKDEMICIYSDYDADGIPGAVILSDFFEKIGYSNFFVYIPHRNREGFGLNRMALDTIKDKGASLVITIDCGCANVSEVEYANSSILSRPTARILRRCCAEAG